MAAVHAGVYAHRMQLVCGRSGFVACALDWIRSAGFKSGEWTFRQHAYVHKSLVWSENVVCGQY